MVNEKKIPVQGSAPAQAGDTASVGVPSDAMGVSVKVVRQEGTGSGSGNANTTAGIGGN